MPPRLQCLNAVVAASKTAFSFRAAFSSSSKALSDIPQNSTSDLLSTIGNFKAPARRSNFTINKHIVGALARSERNRLPTRRLSDATAEDIARDALARDLTKQITRRWRAGDVYAPHDLSPVEMMKWRKRGKPQTDVFDVLELDPLVEWKNFSLLSEYMTPMGRIKSSLETGLRNKNQRKIAKAIRRSIGMGFMPSVHRHPEILMKQTVRRNEQMTRLNKPVV